MYPDYKVEAAGYTDDITIKTNEFDSNWDSSSRRSLNFMKYLLISESINQARFRSIGYGEYQPIDTNLTHERRAKNRRVDVYYSQYNRSQEYYSLRVVFVSANKIVS
ncbi:OmpA/MotB family protein [Desulfosporosinus fructosivorans]